MAIWLFAYIDPSVVALILQFLTSFVVGAYYFFNRGWGKVRELIRKDWTASYGSWVIAFSFANLALLRVWTELFGFSEQDAFEMKSLPPSSHYAACLLSLVVIAVFIWLVIRQTSRSSSAGWVSSVLFLFACAIPLNAVRDVLGSQRFPLLRFSVVRMLGPTRVALIGFVFVLLAGAIAIFFARPLCRFVFLFLLVSSLFTLSNVAKALWRLTHTPQQLDTGLESRSLQKRSENYQDRIVWIVFDELDERLTFEDRPAGLELPELDRFRKSSVYASAVEEAGGDTIPAVPAMITGRPITGYRELGPSRLGLRFEGSKDYVDLGTTDDVFYRASNLGSNVGIVGWGIPYCRIFASELQRCWWCESVRPDNSIRGALLPATVDGLRSLFETQQFSIFGQSICLRQQIVNYLSLTRQAEGLAADSNINFAFLHMHGAHPPHVFDRKRRDFTLANRPLEGYTDSLALCDNTLGRLKLAMQKAGLWESSIVLVTSDHHSRSSRTFDGKLDHRIVFMVKLAGQHDGLTFAQSISAIVSADLVTTLLHGGLHEPGEVANWMSKRATGVSLN
jgi:Sulfatase